MVRTALTASLLLTLGLAVACSDSDGSTGSGGAAQGGAAAGGAGSGAEQATGAAGPGGAGSGATGPGGGGVGGSSGTGMVMGDVCTEFDLDENPIDESGLWKQQGGLTGLDWTNVQSQGGIAFGTLTGFDGYNDSIALLGGFGPDHAIEAVIHFDGERSDATSTHEVELILRGSYDPNDQHIYECNIGYAGAAGWYSQIIVLNGPIGTFADITQGINTVPDVKDGDVFRAEIVGNTIHTYLNGLELATATDDTLPSGQPGVGFFWRGTENVSDFGFKSVCASSL